MKLTETERERITDGVLKIQSVRDSLDYVGPSKIPKRQEIEECLQSVDHNFRKALGYARSDSAESPCEKRKDETEAKANSSGSVVEPD
jgi:hypothetical protein